MKTWKALRGVVWIVLIVSLTLGGIQILLTNGITGILIPTPDTVAQQFVSAMAAHRYEGAQNLLSQQVKSQLSSSSLQQKEHAIEKNDGYIESTSAINAQENGQQATVLVQVKFFNQKQVVLTFSLILENHIWKIASLDPLSKITGGS